jgi:hypothetical protein
MHRSNEIPSYFFTIDKYEVYRFMVEPSQTKPWYDFHIIIGGFIAVN